MRHLIRRAARTVSAFLFLAFCLSAQEQLEFHSCTGQIGAGVAGTSGDDSRYLQSHAASFQAGGGFAITPRFAMIADYLYQQYSISAAGLATVSTPPPVGGKIRYQSVTLEPTVIAIAGKIWNVYGLAGFGWLGQTAKFTASGGETLSNPGSLLAKGGGSADSGAFDAGAGANLKPSRYGFRLFAEFRYLHGLARNSDEELYSVTGGMRW